MEGAKVRFEDWLETVPATVMQIMMALSEQDEFAGLTAKQMNETWGRVLMARVGYNVKTDFGRRQLSGDVLAADPLLALAARPYNKSKC